MRRPLQKSSRSRGIVSSWSLQPSVFQVKEGLCVLARWDLDLRSPFQKIAWASLARYSIHLSKTPKVSNQTCMQLAKTTISSKDDVCILYFQMESDRSKNPTIYHSQILEGLEYVCVCARTRIRACACVSVYLYLFL